MANCTLTTEERAAMLVDLADAKAALKEILMGNKAKVVVDQNGERVEFAAANVDRLRAWITEMEYRLGLCRGGKPMRFWGTG